MGRKIEIELPEEPATPDLSVHPMVAEIRERLARLEERTTSDGVDPAAAEALRLASDAREVAARAEAAAERVAAQLESTIPQAGPVIHVEPPAALPLAPERTAEPETAPEHHPWFHPKRWI